MESYLKAPKSSNKNVIAPRPIRFTLPKLRSTRLNPFLNSKSVRKSPDREEAYEEVSKIISLPLICKGGRVLLTANQADLLPSSASPFLSEKPVLSGQFLPSKPLTPSRVFEQGVCCIGNEVPWNSVSPPRWTHRVSLNPIIMDKAFKAMEDASEASTTASQASL
jgi:hypothetical protein